MKVIGNKVLVKIIENTTKGTLIRLDKVLNNLIGEVLEVGTGEFIQRNLTKGEKILFKTSIEIPELGHIVDLHDIIAIYTSDVEL